MRVTQLPLEGCFSFEAPTFPDERGFFSAPFHAPTFIDTVGYEFSVRQTNLSPTRRGALRGLHFADVPPGQAKYVYAASGNLLDVLVDLRVGSPTFGEHVAIELSPESGTAVFLPEGLGHLVIGLTDNAALSYLCSEAYNPPAEHGVTPLDPEIRLPLDKWCEDFQLGDKSCLRISLKDREAPTLRDAYDLGLLPRYDECVAYYDRLRHG